MRGLGKNCIGRGQTDRQTHRQTDIATTRKNWPKGQFFENIYILTLDHSRVYFLLLLTLERCVHNTNVIFFWFPTVYVWEHFKILENLVSYLFTFKHNAFCRTAVATSGTCYYHNLVL